MHNDSTLKLTAIFITNPENVETVLNFDFGLYRYWDYNGFSLLNRLFAQHSQSYETKQMPSH